MQDNYSPRQTIFAFAASIALAFCLTSCNHSPSPATDDGTLTASVQSRIAGDGALSAESIQSSVQNGIVTLTGNVSSDAARSLAATDAAQITGVKTVINNLVVQPGTPSAAGTSQPAPMHPLAKVSPPIKLKPAPIVRQPQPQEAQAPPPSSQIPPINQEIPPQPPAPPAPAFRNITLPAGTILPIRITQTLDSASTQQGDTFTGTVAADIIIDNLTVLRQGAAVGGRVSAVQEAAHYKGSSLLTVELTSISHRGEKLSITTDAYSVQGKGRGKNTAEKVGGGAAVGAILGGIFGGGKGAAIGAAAGGGVGAGANTVTRGEQVQIPSETLIRFQLNSPLLIRVSTKPAADPASSPDLQTRPQDQPSQ